MERADESVSDENNRAAGKCRPRDASARGGFASSGARNSFGMKKNRDVERERRQR